MKRTEPKDWRNIPQCVVDCCEDFQSRLVSLERKLFTLKDESRKAIAALASERTQNNEKFSKLK